MEQKPLEHLCALVDDEIIDLNNYRGRANLIKRTLSRCTSNQTLPDKKGENHAANWKKLANNLYKPIPTFSTYKTYPRDRLKQGRATSADPRFRQERKSSSNLNVTPSETKLKSTISTRHSPSKETDPNPDSAPPTDSPPPPRRTRSSRNCAVARHKSRTYLDINQHDNLDKRRSSRDTTDHSFYGSAQSVGKCVAFDGTDTAGRGTDTAGRGTDTTGGGTVEFDTLNTNFVSSDGIADEGQPTLINNNSASAFRSNDWQETLAHSEDDLYDTNNPDWTNIEVYKSQNVDPNLVRHAQIIKSNHFLKKSKSSWTMPVVKHKLPSGVCVCQRCSCTKRSTHTYLYDNLSEVTNVKVSRNNGKLWSQFKKNYHIFFCFVMGSLIGLILVASVVWLLSNDQLWTLFNKPEVRKVNPVRRAIMSVGGGIHTVISGFFNTIYRTCMLPRNAVYSPAKEDPATLSQLITSIIM